MVQAVIFDCDGVLVDSETLGNQVLAKAVRDLGLSLTLRQAQAAFKGQSMSTCVAILEQWLGGPLPPDFVTTVRSEMATVFRQQLRPVAGIETVLQQMRLPFCVASSGPREKIELTLGVTGLLPYFVGRIYSAYEVGSWKPAPDLFLHAARRMGVVPGSCAVVEDSVSGVQAGLAAGMTVFGYARPQDKSDLHAAGAHVFDDMLKLPQLLHT